MTLSHTASLPPSSHFRRWILVAILATVTAIGGALLWFSLSSFEKQIPVIGKLNQEAAPVLSTLEPPSGAITLSRDSWNGAGITIQPVTIGTFSQNLQLTGKIALNEDHVAHIFPLVEGRVDEVRIHFGDRVKKGDLLVVVQSKEVGQAKLDFFQNRLRQQLAVTRADWTSEIATNARALMASLREGDSLDAIDEKFKDLPLGDFREQLLSAYIALYRSTKDLERLKPLSLDGIVPSKQIMIAESENRADLATLQSSLEQIEQQTRQSLLLSRQSVQEAETRVAVDATNLKILGFDDDEINNIDPTTQGSAISHYPVASPFDGTIISKDVVLLERVGPEKQILSIADLSTVWVTADIFEQHLPLLENLSGSLLSVRSAAWPQRTFEARIFYTGDIVDESSRTIAMRAVANNAEGFLKPGMFVTVDLPGIQQTGVIQVPADALFEHEGKPFGFVYEGEERFQRRDVEIGQRSPSSVQIIRGIAVGESIVASGGFSLKSRMLASLLEGE